jgi:hypothetical protein
MKHLGFSREGRLAWVTFPRIRFHRRPWALDVSMGAGVLFIHGGAFVELNVLVWGWVFWRGRGGGVWNELGLLVLERLQFLFWGCVAQGGPKGYWCLSPNLLLWLWLLWVDSKCKLHGGVTQASGGFRSNESGETVAKCPFCAFCFQVVVRFSQVQWLGRWSQRCIDRHPCSSSWWFRY